MVGITALVRKKNLRGGNKLSNINSYRQRFGGTVVFVINFNKSKSAKSTYSLRHYSISVVKYVPIPLQQYTNGFSRVFG